jgi:hypothetical protein
VTAWALAGLGCGGPAQAILTRYEEEIIEVHAELKEARAKTETLRERNSSLDATCRESAVQVRPPRAHTPHASAHARTCRVPGAEGAPLCGREGRLRSCG